MGHDVGAKCLHRVGDGTGNIAITADKLRRMPEGEIQNVVNDQNLAIALGAGADSDGRRLDLRSNQGGDFAGNPLEVEAGDAGAIERNGITHELIDGFKRFALHLVTAHDIDRLWRQTDVTGNGNFSVDHSANEVGSLFSAFHLYRFGTTFFDEAGGVANGFIGGDME